MPTSIFVSCVSSEFEADTAAFPGLRGKLARALERADCHVRHQESFCQAAGGTLLKLDGYVKNCDAVLHLCGRETGARPTENEVDEYLDVEPAFREEFMVDVDWNIHELSYTQWEAYLARYHGVPLYVYAIDQGVDDAHVARLRELGRFPTKFEDAETLMSLLIGDLGAIVPQLGVVSEPIPPYSASFHGRQSQLATIRESFERRDRGQPSLIVLKGVGGSGKSELALKYAHLNKRAYPGGCLFVACDEESPRTTIANLASQVCPEYREKSSDERVERVRSTLHHGPRSLLILDNVLESGFEDLARLLPHGACDQLVTTRWDLDAEHNVLVDGLPPEDAIEVLSKFRKPENENDTQAMHRISELFGGWPLGLVVCGEFARTNGWEECCDELEKVGMGIQEVVAENCDSRAPAERSIHAIFDEVLEKINHGHKRALYYAAMLPPDEVPVLWLASLLEADEDIKLPKQRNSALRQVREFLCSSYLRRRGDDGSNIANDFTLVSLHRVLRFRLRERLGLKSPHSADDVPMEDFRSGGNARDSNLRDKLFKNVIDLLKGRQKQIDNAMKNVASRSEVRALVDMVGELRREGQVRAAIELANKIHDTVRDLGEFEECRRALVWLAPEDDAGRSRIEKHIREGELTVEDYAAGLSKLAVTESDVVERAKMAFGPGQDLLDTSCGLARSREDSPARFDLTTQDSVAPEPDRAETLASKAVRIAGKHLGPSHPFLAMRESNLALVLQRVGDLDRAEYHVNRSIAIDRTHLGDPNHPHFVYRYSIRAYILRDRATVALRAGRREEAKALFEGARTSIEEATRIDELHHGKEHYNHARDLVNRAIIECRAGEQLECGHRFNTALEILRKLFPANHRRISDFERLRCSTCPGQERESTVTDPVYPHWS